MVLFIEDT